MSGNYNTWGGKNNRWGNRNRKGSSNTSSTSNRNTHYEPSKAFNVLAGGVCLFLLGALGLNLITGAISGIKDGLDTAKDAVSIVKDTTGATGTNGTNENSSTVMDRIEANVIDNLDFEIDAEDISDILEYASDELSSSVDDMILLNYSDVSTVDGYTHNIIEKLYDCGKTAVFSVVCDNTLNSITIDEQKEAIKNMATSNKELLRSYNVSEVITGGLSGLKSVSSPVVTITYIK